MKKLNHFLLLNYPLIWRSRIIYIILGSVVTTLFFVFFIDEFDSEIGPESEYDNHDDEVFGYTLLFIWSFMGLMWLYTQYQHELTLKRYDFSEILKVSLLNTFCFIIAIIPLFPLFEFTLDNSYEKQEVYQALRLYSYLLFMPIIFLSFFIRFYSLVEIMLILISGAGYFLFIFFNLAIRIDGAPDIELNFMGVSHYIGALGYIYLTLKKKRYTKMVKSLSFLLVIVTPLFFSSVISLIFSINSSLSPSEPFFFQYYNRLDLDLWGTAFLTSFFFLNLLTWFILRTLKKPMVVH